MSRTSNIAVVIYRTGLIKLGFKSILLAVIAGKANQAVLRQLIREIHLNEASQHNDTNSETNSYLLETCGRISQRTDIAVITQNKNIHAILLHSQKNESTIQAGVLVFNRHRYKTLKSFDEIQGSGVLFNDAQNQSSFCEHFYIMYEPPFRSCYLSPFVSFLSSSRITQRTYEPSFTDFSSTHTMFEPPFTFIHTMHEPPHSLFFPVTQCTNHFPFQL